MKRILITLFILFCLTLPLLAQDPTQEATPDASAPVVVNIEQPTTSTPQQTGFLTIIVTSVLSFIVGAGATLGMAARWIKEAINDPVKMTLAEKVGNSIPQESVKGFVDFLDAAKAFVTEATDQKAAIAKIVTPTPDSGFTSTPADNLK